MRRDSIFEREDRVDTEAIHAEWPMITREGSTGSFANDALLIDAGAAARVSVGGDGHTGVGGAVSTTGIG